MGAQLSGILQLALTIQDIARATTFYRDVLGLRLLVEGPNMEFFDCGGVRLYLTCGDGAAHMTGGGSIYFRTADMGAQCAALKSCNVQIYQEPHLLARMPDHDLWLMWIRDSEDNLLGIMEERKN
jgi:methylmalonyl-CoA/ethylmalonyl-CoA epimerase